MIIVVTKLGVRGMALYPFILIRNAKDRYDFQLIQHELIHHKQQIELLILPFYIFYLLEYLYHRFKGRNHNEAYLNISFEKEAYLNDDVENYLQKRKLWSFMRYMN